MGQSYYNKQGRAECWDEMVDVNVGGTAIFDLWNAYKYLYRAGDKADNPKDMDLAKADSYIKHARNIISEQTLSEEVLAICDDMMQVLEGVAERDELPLESFK